MASQEEIAEPASIYCLTRFWRLLYAFFQRYCSSELVYTSMSSVLILSVPDHTITCVLEWSHRFNACSPKSAGLVQQGGSTAWHSLPETTSHVCFRYLWDMSTSSVVILRQVWEGTSAFLSVDCKGGDFCFASHILRTKEDLHATPKLLWKAEHDFLIVFHIVFHIVYDLSSMTYRRFWSSPGACLRDGACYSGSWFER